MIFNSVPIKTVMTSFTVSLTGNTSVLTSTFFPEIVLDKDYNYSCGLLDFTTYQSIPNITWKNNEFKYKPEIEGVITKSLYVPVGCYEAEDVLNYIKTELAKENISFEFDINKNTLKTLIKCSLTIINTHDNSILKVFGFKQEQIEAIYNTISSDVIKISQLNVIRVECNIISGAYINGKPCHSIYEFASNKVDIGYKIVEQPSNVIYMPIVPKHIDCIQIKIVDQDGNLIDLRGEEVTCRIHIKRDNY